MIRSVTSLALAALLCGCTAGDDAASATTTTDDATIGTPAPGDPDNASDQPPRLAVDDGDRQDVPGNINDVEVPERYRGDWAASAEACDRAGEVSRLSIDDDNIRFYESEGPIVSLVDQGDELTLLTRLTGEGETRTASYTFRLSADGNTLTDLDGFERLRCD